MGDVVLVTGGAGYIGSHVCKALAESEFVPVCYDTLERGHDWAVKWGPLACGDIGDADRLSDVVERVRPRAIVHMAGYIDVAESVKQPHLYFCNNAVKSNVLIEVALRHGVKDLVFSSSCAVYGRPDEKLVSESHPMVPLSPYAQSKAQVEAALTVAAARGLCSVSLRYFNAAGADETAEIGEAHAPETHLLPLAVDAALGLGSQLTVLGHDHPTPDGSCIRDFVHVTDLADAHIRALRWLRTAASTGVHEQFNVGSGSGYSVLEVIAETGRIARRPVPYIIGANRPGDSPRLVGNISKSMRELGWQPTRGLALQIEDTLRWRRRMPRS